MEGRGAAGLELLAPYLAVRLVPHHRLQLCQPLLQLRNLETREARAERAGQPILGSNAVTPPPHAHLGSLGELVLLWPPVQLKGERVPGGGWRLGGALPCRCLLALRHLQLLQQAPGRGEKVGTLPWYRLAGMLASSPCCPPLPKLRPRAHTHLASAPSGSAKSMAAAGPSSFSRWLETSCCFRPSTCLAKAMGVSSSSAADSFTALCAGGDRQQCQPPGTICPQVPNGRGGAHLDLLHLPDQLLHLVLQPLVPLLRSLFGTNALTVLQRDERGGERERRGVSRGLGACPRHQGSGSAGTPGPNSPGRYPCLCKERNRPEKPSS